MIMKKYFSMAAMAALFSLGLVSCDVETDEEPGGTNVEKMAGRWEVIADVIDEQGNIVNEDPYGIGEFEIQTYNTTNNDLDQMWLTDVIGTSPQFWDFRFKVNVNYQARTFTATDVLYNADMREIAAAKAAGTPYVDDDGNELVAETATILNGKVLEGACKNLHGMPNDSIVVDIKFTDDGYGFIYRLSGHRYTGFYE